LRRYEQVRPALLFSIRPSSFDEPVEKAIDSPPEDAWIGWKADNVDTLRWADRGRYIVGLGRVRENGQLTGHHVITKVIDGRTGRPTDVTVTEVEKFEWQTNAYRDSLKAPDRARRLGFVFEEAAAYFENGSDPRWFKKMGWAPVVLPCPGTRTLLTGLTRVGSVLDRRGPDHCWNVWDEDKLPR
jgi:hypothetical protein